jgi:cyclophilin family peptidyl-prolyl cis-trans isomerase
MKALLKATLIGLFITVGLAQEPAKPGVEEKKEAPKEAKEVTVLMATSLGDIHIQLDSKNAPKTVENFLKYVDDKAYDGTIFHRVINGFMIQGGGFKVEDGRFMKQKTRPAIKNESENTPANKTGTIAMARLPNPHSASNQFFINVADNDALNYPNNGGGYATFGKVTKGMDIVEKIKAVKTGSKNGMSDVPEKTVTIKSISRSK